MIYAFHAARIGVSIKTIVLHCSSSLRPSEMINYLKSNCNAGSYYLLKGNSYSHVMNNDYLFYKKNNTTCGADYTIIPEDTIKEMVADWLTVMVFSKREKYGLTDNPVKNKDYQLDDLGINIRAVAMKLSSFNDVGLDGSLKSISPRMALIYILFKYDIIDGKLYDEIYSNIKGICVSKDC